MLLASLIETRMSKQDILHAYLCKVCFKTFQSHLTYVFLNYYVFISLFFFTHYDSMMKICVLVRTYNKTKCLQIYWGHGIHGIEAAANFYFGKPPLLLTIGECAMLAGMIPAPEILSPFRDPSRWVYTYEPLKLPHAQWWQQGQHQQFYFVSKSSQPYVVLNIWCEMFFCPRGKQSQRRALQRMVETGILDKNHAQVIISQDLELRSGPTEMKSRSCRAPFFVDEVVHRKVPLLKWRIVWGHYLYLSYDSFNDGTLFFHHVMMLFLLACHVGDFWSTRKVWTW